ncbi:hypothetical protein EV204_105167 [Tissierella praeacuta]|uniref:LAGLIDADG family homing endonuclease n=1 Tax=Tissierella praeacuta TaxID=43131 RepID=UPI00104917CB|nr:LAGLIDADG family homing endonuclease [Tissierella praeacuta]TCU72831.1 hypothetical protein EV204_105167 [Tissierella praeacuta]
MNKSKNNTFSDDIVSELYNEGHSLENISKMFNVSRRQIRNSLHRTKTEIRSRLPYDVNKRTETVDYAPYNLSIRETRYTNSHNKYSSSNKVYTDELFFSSWSHELAYFLGWVASDGNISMSKNVFRITSTDIEHLESLFSLFSYGWTTTIREWNSKEQSHYLPAGTISIAREDIMNKLIDYGIPPNKSLIMEMPYIPSEYVRDFVRGVFEGDGCITYKNNLSPKIVFATGSKNFAYGLGKAIEKQTGLKIHVYVDCKETWTLEYDSITSVKMLFQYMYKGVPSELILKRKYNVFVELFTLRNEVDIIGNNDKHSREGKSISQETTI